MLKTCAIFGFMLLTVYNIVWLVCMENTLKKSALENVNDVYNDIIKKRINDVLFKNMIIMPLLLFMYFFSLNFQTIVLVIVMFCLVIFTGDLAMHKWDK